MRFDTPLQAGTLVRRYKRFLADVRLPDGEVITVHTPNTGSMLGCSEPESRVWIRDSGNPKRKYRHGWEIAEAAGGVLVGVNTGLSNGLVREGIEKGVIAELQGYDAIRQEVRYGRENSRIDLLLRGGADGRDCYVEVKNVTAAAGGVAFFPDAVTARGSKHLRELMEVSPSHRAVLCFCVQRGDARTVRPADEIDPVYGQALRQAIAGGVEVIAYRAEVNPEGIALACPLPVVCS